MEDYMGFFDKLREGLGKTKQTLNEKINDVFANFRKVDEDLLDELEEALIMSDIGIETSTKIINELRIRIKKENIQKLYEKVESELSPRERLVLKMRYGLYNGEEYTQREIASLLGISRSYVSRIEKSAVEKLRVWFC